MIKTVVKRDGSVEPFDPSKINNMAIWAVGTNNVTWSDIAISALRNLGDVESVTAQDIQSSLVKTCIDREDFAHNLIAGRLYLCSLRKESFAAKRFADHYYEMQDAGLYREMAYTEEEVEHLGEIVDNNYDRDLTYGYATLRQFSDKYALRDGDGRLLELPQYMYMGIAMSMMEGEPLENVVMYYEKASQQKINLPSPVLSQQRTPNNTGVSCVITTAGDTLHGIEASKHIAFMATASSAGLGVEYDVRSVGDDVRNGYATAGGKLPHYRVLDKTVKEVKQSSRGGSATVSFKVIDPEIETLLVLKLKRSPETKRIDQLDYSVLWNNDFLRRAAKKQPWALVSKVECPELWDSFSDDIKFTEIMDKVLADPNIKKKVVNAFDILSTYIDNRLETGRIYRTNLTEVNLHTPFKEEVRLSNLCQEVLLPTKPYNHITELYKNEYNAGDGMTAQCFLSAIDVAKIESDEDYEEAAYIALLSLDNLIEDMSYPFPQFKVTAQAYRSVGVGITNLAYYLAKEGKTYSDVETLHWLAERHYYFLLKASVRIAKERGSFLWIHKTKWADGWLPIDTYNRNIDNVIAHNTQYDWKALRMEVLRYGVRFSTLSAFMPCESSSVFGNSTNSLYPIRDRMVYKDSKKGKVQFFAPYVDTLKYEYAWDVDPYVLLNMYGIFQKWCDQTISADTYVRKVEGEKLSKAELVRQHLYSNKIGMKTLYYNNTRSGRGEGSVIQAESECESCSL